MLERVYRDENPCAETARLLGVDRAILDSPADRGLRQAGPLREFRWGQKWFRAAHDDVIT